MKITCARKSPHEAKLIAEKVQQAADGTAGLLADAPENMRDKSESAKANEEDSGEKGSSKKQGKFDDGASLFAPSTVMFKTDKHAYQSNTADIKKAYLQAERRMHGVESVKQTKKRRLWVAMTWLATWWIPWFLLKWMGRMKRGDVRMAWREKVLIKFVFLSDFTSSHRAQFPNLVSLLCCCLCHCHLGRLGVPAAECL